MCQKKKHSKSGYILTLNLAGWTLSYTASAREMHLVFATPTVGMKPVSLCLLELCSLACIDMPTVLRNRAGGYVSLLTSSLLTVICFLVSLLYIVPISGGEGLLHYQKLLHSVSIHRIVLPASSSLTLYFNRASQDIPCFFFKLPKSKSQMTIKFCCPNFIQL